VTPARNGAQGGFGGVMYQITALIRKTVFPQRHGTGGVTTVPRATSNETDKEQF
jgi:hypothetical protein